MSHESPAPVHAHTSGFRAGNSRLRTAKQRTACTSKNKNCEFYYLNKKYNEEIEVGYSSELLEQVLWDKIPNCVLKEKGRKQPKCNIKYVQRAALQTAAAHFPNLRRYN